MSMVQDLLCEQTRVVGMKQVLRYAQVSRLSKIFIAKDADKVIIERLKLVCEQNRIKNDVSYTMQQIGSACCIEVGSACAAVLKRQN